MTETVSTISMKADSAGAGAELGRAIRIGFDGHAADAVVVFASSRHDPTRLLEALAEESGTSTIAGSSSAGEFVEGASGEGGASALALRSRRMEFSVGLGRGIREDPVAAARQAVQSFRGRDGSRLPYRTALVMTDALAGHADAVVEELTLATGGNYRFVGGGAGDDAAFRETHVFAGTQAVTDAVVALEILSEDPVGVGVSHGWEPAGPGMRVTESEGERLISLNGLPAIHAYEAHAEATGQTLDRSDPLPFFLHNILGIESGGDHRLRVPLGIGEDGSIACAASVPAGTVVHIMKTTTSSAIRAAENATRSAIAGLGSHQPGAGLVFDCVATRLRLGQAFEDELASCAELLRPAGFVGCNTYGQIARAEGQFGGFHNCTAVVCVLPA